MVSRPHLYPISPRAFVAAACGGAVGLMLFVPVALAQPTVVTDRGCYLVGQTVQLSGQGFQPSGAYVVTLDGVYLGSSTTNDQGGFSIPVHPGGLPAGTAQHVEHVTVSDGTSQAASYFTLTRSAGARIVVSGTTVPMLKARFDVWDFSPSGAPLPVYVHYVRPSGGQAARAFLGTTGGQCGWIATRRKKLFPFAVSPGTWTLQIDTNEAYAPHPDGPVTRIRVTIP